MKTLHVMGMDFVYKASFKAYSSAIVERIWNGIGKLTVELNSGIANSALIEENDILWFDDEPQSYIVEKIIEKLNGSELTLEIVAPAVECLLADFITIPPAGAYDTITGTREAVVRNWVTNNCINPADVSRAVYPITLGTLNGLGQSITEQTRYKNLLEEVQRILLAEDLGFELARGDNGFIFNVIQGADKTSTSSSLATRIVFGLKYGNISGYTRTKDVSPYKNVAYVAGQGEGEERNIVKVDGQTGIRRKEVFVDARDTNEAAMLLDRGEQSLTAATPVDTFEFEAINKQFEYKRDYDLGDFVTIVIDSLNQTDRQIKKITEIYERGNIRVIPEFGKLERTVKTVIGSVETRVSRLEAEYTSGGSAGEPGPGLEFIWNGTQLGVRKEGDAVYQYVDLEGPEGPQGIQGVQGVDGNTGKSLEFTWSGTQLGVRQEGQITYTYVDLKGQKGDTGLTGPQGETGLTGSAGEDGRGIVSVTRTSGTGAAGTSDTYTITFTDLTTSTFLVYNGADGEGYGDMLKATYDPNSKNADAFSMVNMVEGATQKIFTDVERSKLAGVANNANNYVHPTTAGNKHIPTGGTVGQILKNTASGTATWQNESVTTIVNTLTETVTGKALDATQGKALKDSVDAKAITATYTGTLLSSGWTGSSAPYSQTITVTGMASTDEPIYDLTLSGTYATDVTLETEWANVFDLDTGTNQVTVKAHAIPTVDLPFRMKVVR